MPDSPQFEEPQALDSEIQQSYPDPYPDPYPNEDRVKQIIAQTLIDAGFYFETNGVRFSSEEALKSQILDEMITHHVVHNRNDLGKAVTQWKLYKTLFPNGPGVQVDVPKDDLETQKALKKLLSQIWGYINTGTTGAIQQRVASTGLLLCEADVSRSEDQEPGTARGRFLTADPDLIDDYVDTFCDEFIKSGRKASNKAGLVINRRPELTKRVAKKLQKAVRETIAGIPLNDPKYVAGLTAGNNDEAASE